MQATQQESDAYYAKVEGEICTLSPPLNPVFNLISLVSTVPTPNFISEIFFLCASFLHTGPMHAIKEHKGLMQQLSQMKRHIDDLEADTTWRGVRYIP